MALLTLVYVLATMALVLLAQRQLKQATQIERSRTRPQVVLDMIWEEASVYIIVQNLGQTAARNITFSISPELKCLIGGQSEIPEDERSLDIPFLARGIGMLAPQRTIRSYVGTWSRVKATYPSLQFNGSLAYNGEGAEMFREDVLLDLRTYDGLLHISEKGIEEIATSLERINTEIRHIASGFSKPLVRTMTEKEYNAAIEEALAKRETNAMKAQPESSQDRG